MLAFRGQPPTGLINRIHQLTFIPGPAVRDATTVTVVASVGATILNDSDTLGITDVAKYKFSYAHKPEKITKVRECFVVRIIHGIRIYQS